MRKCQSALQCELLFIDNCAKEQPKTKSRKGMLGFTLWETETKYSLGNEQFWENGGLLRERCHALSLPALPNNIALS